MALIRWVNPSHGTDTYPHHQLDIIAYCVQIIQVLHFYYHNSTEA